MIPEIIKNWHFEGLEQAALESFANILDSTLWASSPYGDR